MLTENLNAPSETEGRVVIDDYSQIITTCLYYMAECEANEISGYAEELNKVLNGCETDEERWLTLIHSGLFHDAYGEVVSFDNESVVYSFEY